MWNLNIIRTKGIVGIATAMAIAGCGGSSADGGGLGGISLNAQATSTTSIRLTWTEPGNGVTVSPYRVARDDQQSSSVIGSTTDLFYTVAGLSPGTQYCFVIRNPLTGNIMSNRACATTTADTSAPSTPSGFTAAAVSPAQVDLEWNFASDDHRVAGYNIYRDGALLFSVTARNAMDSNTSPGIDHCYQVSAYDDAGNESPRSAQICVDAEPDFTPPTTPADVSAIFDPSRPQPVISVNWSPSSDNGRVDFYRVIRNDIHVADVSGSSYDDEALGQGGSFCYVISAVDTYGNESNPSEPACAREGWTTTTLESTRAVATAVTVDNTGAIHVAFKEHVFDAGLGEVRHPLSYVRLESGQVSTQEILESGSETMFFNDAYRLAMVADHNNVIHIAHKRNESPFGEAIRHLQVDGSAVTATAIEATSNAMDSISLAVDSVGAIHACYGLGGDLMYATNTTGVWITANADSLVPGAGGGVCDIAVDAFDHIHISFLESGSKDLMYLSDVAGSWTLDRIDVHSGTNVNTSHNTSIGVDSAGNAHIAYFHDYADNDLEYASNASGAWTSVKVDSDGDVGYNCEIAVDSDGVAHIIYRAQAAVDELRYANNESGNWEIVTLANASSGDTSIAIDPMDGLHVTFVYDDKATYVTNRN